MSMIQNRATSTLLVLTVWSCGGERQVAGPDPARTPQTELTVHATLDSEDAQLQGALAWEEGVPGATVHLLRVGTGEWKTERTDESGEATFRPVLAGTHRLYASRTLSEVEAQGLPGPIRAFGDGRPIEIKGGQTNPVSLSLRADQAGSLVISEVSGGSPPPWETGNTGYLEAQYIEVFNNSDRVEFLDGRLLGGTLHGSNSCTESAGPRADPGGVLATQILAFPGNGGDYPIGPGETRVIPISAIDHTGVHPNLLDLSHADFEIRGVASADNPSVPDMLDVGLERFVLTAGGGSLTPLLVSRLAYFLAEPQDPRALPVVYRDMTGRPWVRIPGHTLTDVAALVLIWPDSERDFTPCSPIVARPFDRYEGGFYPVGGTEPNLSFQRVVLRQEGGRAVLQDTNTSAADFVLADLTPGTQPPPRP